MSKWKKELAAVDERMQILNGEGAGLEIKLSVNQHPAEIAELGKRLSDVNDELRQLEDRWLTLTNQLESNIA